MYLPNLTLYWDGWVANCKDLEERGWQFKIENGNLNLTRRSRICFINKDNTFNGITEYIDDYVLKTYLHEIKLNVVNVEYYAPQINILTYYSASLMPVSFNSDYTANIEFSQPINKLSDYFKTTQNGLLIPDDIIPGLADKIEEIKQPNIQENIKKQNQDKKIITLNANIIRVR